MRHASLTEPEYIDLYSKCKNLENGVHFIENSKEILCLKGFIDDNLQKQLARKLAEFEVNYLILESEGGFLSPAIQMGRAILNRDITVIVGGICASSCSQFLFVAGKNKVVLEGGLVVFHGGPLSYEKIDSMEITNKQKENLYKEQDDFRTYYDDLGIDMAMLTSPPPDIQNMLDKGQIVFWGWPKEKLESFGVTGIEIYRQKQKG